RQPATGNDQACAGDRGPKSFPVAGRLSPVACSDPRKICPSDRLISLLMDLSGVVASWRFSPTTMNETPGRQGRHQNFQKQATGNRQPATGNGQRTAADPRRRVDRAECVYACLWSFPVACCLLPVACSDPNRICPPDLLTS